MSQNHESFQIILSQIMYFQKMLCLQKLYERHSVNF